MSVIHQQGLASGKIKFIDEHQVAEMVGLSVKTLRRWRLFGRGPKYHKLNGRAVRYEIAEIEAWVAAQPTGGGRAA